MLIRMAAAEGSSSSSRHKRKRSRLDETDDVESPGGRVRIQPAAPQLLGVRAHPKRPMPGGKVARRVSPAAADPDDGELLLPEDAQTAAAVDAYDAAVAHCAQLVCFPRSAAAAALHDTSSAGRALDTLWAMSNVLTTLHDRGSVLRATSPVCGTMRCAARLLTAVTGCLGLERGRIHVADMVSSRISYARFDEVAILEHLAEQDYPQRQFGLASCAPAAWWHAEFRKAVQTMHDYATFGLLQDQQHLDPSFVELFSQVVTRVHANVVLRVKHDEPTAAWDWAPTREARRTGYVNVRRPEAPCCVVCMRSGDGDGDGGGKEEGAEDLDDSSDGSDYDDEHSTTDEDAILGDADDEKGDFGRPRMRMLPHYADT